MAEDFSALIKLEVDQKASIAGINTAIQGIQNSIGSIKVKIDFDKDAINSIKSSLGSLKTLTKDIGSTKSSGGNIIGQKGQIDGVTSSYREMLSLVKEINSKQLKIASLDTRKDRAEIEALQGSIQKLRERMDGLSFGNMSDTEVRKIYEEYDRADMKLQELKGHMADAARETQLSERAKAMGESLKQQAQEAKAAYDSFISDVQKVNSIELNIAKLDPSTNVEQIKQLNAELEVYRQRVQAYKEANPNADMSEADEIYRRTAESIGELNAKMADASRTKAYNQNFKELIATVKEINSLQIKQLGLDPKKNAAEYATLGRQIDDLRGKQASLLKTLGDLPADKQQQYNAVLESTDQELARVQARAMDAKTHLGGLFSGIKNSFIQAGAYMFSGYRLFYTMSNAVRNTYQNIVEIDSAMTELKKVTDETTDSYNKFLQDAGKNATRIGSTVTDYINSTADFARLGYNFSEAQKLAEVANIYSVVGDEIDSIDEASQSVISTMAAFGIEASDAMSIIDKFNEVGNTFAISSGGIGEALQRSAAALHTANATLDESVALITAGNTVVQNPEMVGVCADDKNGYIG